MEIELLSFTNFKNYTTFIKRETLRLVKSAQKTVQTVRPI